MGVPPRLPNLDPRDMAWVRWATDELSRLSGDATVLRSNVDTATQLAGSTAAAHATTVEKVTATRQVAPELPTAPPQTPTSPLLSTDHGTVTIRWDGQMHANLSYTPQPGDDAGPVVDPAVGFNHVSVYRADSASGPFTIIATALGRAGSVVDTNVTVGSTYWYYLVTTDNLKAKGTPSDAASITVVGVDLGTLDQDVKDALQSAQDAAAAGLAAGQAGKDAAQAALDAANSVSGQAADALQAASDAQQTAQSALAAAEEASGGATSVIISNTAPTGGSTVLWIDTTNNANTPKRWNGTAWIALTDKAATDAAAAAVAAQNAANAAQQTANTAITNAQNAQTSATTALTAANGKNRVVYSTSAATGTTGYINGDLWFQHNASNVITAQWQFNGTAWVSQSVSGTLVASGIDAGNITVGSLNASRISANSIAASQMIAGTITAASGILADAVITTAKIADLAVSTAKIADLAVNDAKINNLNGNKITAASIVAGKLAANSVTTNNIVAGAIDTNRITAGAITADKLSLATTAQATSPTNRVPAALTDVNWWSAALTNLVSNASGALNTWAHPNENGHVSAQSWGLVYSPTTTDRAIMGVTPMFVTPPSRKISIRLVASGSIVIQVRQQNGTDVTWSTVTSAANGTFTFSLAPTTTHYGVYLMVPNGGAQTSVSECRVFEVIGTSGNDQSAELSPDGIRLYYGGNPVVDLTTNSDNLLSIMQSSDSGLDTVASIDQGGNGTFNEISGGGYDVNGVDLIGGSVDSTPNGADWGGIALLDRTARGVVYDNTWPSLSGTNVTTQYRRIAQDNFTLEDGRSYEFIVQDGGLQVDNRSNVNIYLELQLNLVPNSSITAGTVVSRAVVYTGNAGNWILAPGIWTASSSVTSIDAVNRLVPANVPIYWQLNFNLSATPAAAYQINEFGNARGFTVIDVGSSYLIRPNGNDALTSVADNSTSGGSSGSTSGGTHTTSTTKTWNASWSRSWKDSGSTVVSGSGTYTNGAAMYQGNGTTPMGSKFGFAALGLSGKTITAMSLYMHNSYISYPGQTVAILGTHGDSSAPGTWTGSRANGWNVSWGNGQGKWINVPSNLWGGFANGTYRGFSLGVSGSNTQYGYWSGATQSGHPALKVTYH